MLDSKTLDRILPQPKDSVDTIESWYPNRQLSSGAEVTRIAPSPTGFMHIGSLYAAFISERVAHLSNGIFYLRIEDTDKKREVEGAKDVIIDSLSTFHVKYDEGPIRDDEIGEYGPYTQSHRREIYLAYIKKLLDEGKAYPCFVTTKELEEIVEKQKLLKIRPGYYGEWAIWRNKSQDEIVEALNANKPFVIRYKSEGNINNKIKINDVIRGERELPENDNDIVFLKADGLPTYHLAHIVDDHLMRTTTVLRGDEWLSSLTLHIQLAESLGIKPFKYGHIAPIQKMDGSSRRKLSKRKDPEADVNYYLEHGYPVEAVMEYLLNQANSNYEQWRIDNPNEPYTNFQLDIKRLPKNSGALLNLVKLDDVSQEYLAKLPPEKLYEVAQSWCLKYDPKLAVELAKDVDYSINILSIEKENNKRKDVSKLSELRDVYGYFFDDIYNELIIDDQTNELMSKVTETDRKSIIDKFLNSYTKEDSQDAWFEKIKQIGEDLGFTSNTKEYRKNPDAFKGSVADVAMVLRVVLTKRNRSPNLYDVMQVMGLDRLSSRLNSF